MTHDTPAQPHSSPDLPTMTFRVATIAGRNSTHVKFVPDVAARRAIADTLGLLELPQMIFDGEIRSSGKRDMVLTGKLTALAVQPCSITLQPVKTKITETVTRKFLADYEVPTGEEVEIPEDDTIEPLGELIDAAAVAIEALALALPLYPRATGVELGEVAAAPPDAEPLRDADLKPFAGLAKLMAKGNPTDEPG